MIWITIALRASEREALRRLALAEGKSVKTQAASLVREGLAVRGRIIAAAPLEPPSQTEVPPVAPEAKKKTKERAAKRV